MKRFFFISIVFAACAIQEAVAASGLDGEQVYKDNCTRCHMAIRTYSPAMEKTITRHMGVRAMLTREEVNAVLSYLADTYGPGQSKSSGARESNREDGARHSTSDRKTTGSGQ